MSNLTTVSNSQFDTLAALVPAPFGPLTRVGSLDSLPRVVPNSRQPIEVYGAGGTNDVHFFISYEDLGDTLSTETILREAYGTRYKFYDLEVFIQSLYFAIKGAGSAVIDPLTTDADDYADVAILFQYYKDFRELPPIYDYIEISKANTVRANFTLTGSGLSRTLTNTSTGYGIDHYTIDWGDGSAPVRSKTLTTANKTWTAGTYTVTLYVAGRGGVSKKSTSVTVS